MKTIIYPNRLRVVLADKQITNRWLARKLSVTDMTVSRWTTNKIERSVSQLIEIAKMLSVRLDDLVEPYSKEGNQ